MNFNQKALDRVIANTDGRIVTISFIKDNGDSRTITGRAGVKYKGQSQSHRMDSVSRAFFLIYSIRDRGFRRIDIDRITSIKSDGLYIFNAEIFDRAHPTAA